MFLQVKQKPFILDHLSGNRSVASLHQGDLPLSSPSQKSPSRAHPSNRTPVRNTTNTTSCRGSTGGDVYDFVETDEQKREVKVKKSPMASSMAVSSAPIYSTFHLQQQQQQHLAMQQAAQQNQQHVNAVSQQQGAISSDPTLQQNISQHSTIANQVSTNTTANHPVPSYVSKPHPPNNQMVGSQSALQQQHLDNVSSMSTGIPAHNTVQPTTSIASKYSDQLAGIQFSHKMQHPPNSAQVSAVAPTHATVAPVQCPPNEQRDSKAGIPSFPPSQIQAQKQQQSNFHSASQILPTAPSNNSSTANVKPEPAVYIQKPIPTSVNQYNHNFSSTQSQGASSLHSSHSSKTPVASVVPQQQVQPTKQASAASSTGLPANTVKVEPFSKAEQDKRLNKPTQKVSPVSVDKSRARKDKDREMLQNSWMNSSTAANTGTGRKTLTSLNSDLGYLSRLNVDDAIQSSEDPSPTSQKTFSPVKIKPEKTTKSDHVIKSESPYNSATNRTENTMEEIRALFSSVKRPAVAHNKEMTNQTSREPVKVEKKDKVSKQHIPTSVKQAPPPPAQQSDNSDEDRDESDEDDDEEDDSSSSEGEDSEDNGSTSSSSEHAEQRTPATVQTKKQSTNSGSNPTSSNVANRNKVATTTSQRKLKHVLNPPPPPQPPKTQTHSKASTAQKVSPPANIRSQTSAGKVTKKKGKVTKKVKSASKPASASSSKKKAGGKSSGSNSNSRKRKQSSSSSSSSDSEDNDQSDSEEESEEEIQDQRKRSALASSMTSTTTASNKKKNSTENTNSSRGKKKTPHVSFKERNRAAAAAAAIAVQSSSNKKNSAAKKSQKSAEKTTSASSKASSKKIMYYQEETCDSPDCLKPSGSTIDWVQCDDCDLWFHTVCVGCNLEVVQKVNASFHCGCV